MNVHALYPGDKILDRCSNILFTVAGKNPYGEGTLLITDKIIAVGALDAPEPDSDIENFRITGNHDYLLSNLHQWLNSDQKNWFQKAHPADTPPSEEYLSLRPTLYDPIGHNAYLDKPGFLAGFSEGFKKKICISAIPCASMEGDGVRILETKVFLPSAAELGLKTGVISEGAKLPLFSDFRMRYSSPSQKCLAESQWQPAYFRAHRMFWYWLRTPNTCTKGFVAYSHFVNPFAYKFACSPWMGIRPMIGVADDFPVRSADNSRGHYYFEEVRL